LGEGQASSTVEEGRHRTYHLECLHAKNGKHQVEGWQYLHDNKIKVVKELTVYEKN
jgi:hypothetical protein